MTTLKVDKYGQIRITQKREKALKTLEFLAFSRLFALAERKGEKPLQNEKHPESFRLSERIQ